VKIIVLTSQEEKYLLEAINPFVDAYLFKSKEKPEDFLEKLDEVAGFKQHQTRDYVTSLLREDESRCVELSCKILEKLKNGALNKEIALDLNISLKYVERLISDLFKKYNVKNRVQLIIKISELKEG